MKTIKTAVKKAVKKIKEVSQETGVQVIDTGRNVKLVVNGRVKRVFRDMEDYNKNK